MELLVVALYPSMYSTELFEILKREKSRMHTLVLLISVSRAFILSTNTTKVIYAVYIQYILSLEADCMNHNKK